MTHTDAELITRIHILVELVGRTELCASLENLRVDFGRESSKADVQDSIVAVHRRIELASDIVVVCRERPPFTLLVVVQHVAPCPAVITCDTGKLVEILSGTAGVHHIVYPDMRLTLLITTLRVYSLAELHPPRI
jgi:hypothetical protein